MSPPGTGNSGRWKLAGRRSRGCSARRSRSVFSIAAPSPGKSRAHLVAVLEVELLRRVAQAVGVVERRLGADAEQHVVRERVLLLQVVAVVGGHQRQPSLRRQPPQHLVGGALLGDAVVLQLEEEVALAEDLAGTRVRPRSASLLGAGRGCCSLISPLRQADSADQALACWRSSSWSMRGL